MHIAAYKAACALDDLDHTAKEMLKNIAGHVEYPATWTTVSVNQLASDSDLGYSTARAAVGRAVDAGYVTVEKRPGQPSRFGLNVERLTPNPARSWQGTLPGAGGGFAPLERAQLESLDNNRNGARRAARNSGRRAPGENLRDVTSPGPTENVVYAHYPNWTEQRLSREKGPH